MKPFVPKTLTLIENYIMSTIRGGIIYAALNKAFSLIDYSIYNNIHKRHEFMKQTVLADKSLTKAEKTEAMRLLNKDYDRNKIVFNEGTKRICEICNQECLATLYCEYCIRNYLKANFSNWTSGSNVIDKLIQNCQMKTIMPNMVVEWIPYNDLQNIKFLEKGGFSEIYAAEWINGKYNEWFPKEQTLKRFGRHKVALKRLENVENANHSWLEEVCNSKNVLKK
jgi:hypothetical protein